jgi:hypothetical protein
VDRETGGPRFCEPAEVAALAEAIDPRYRGLSSWGPMAVFVWARCWAYGAPGWISCDGASMLPRSSWRFVAG